MNVDMEEGNQNALTSSCLSQTGSSSPTPVVFPPANHAGSLRHPVLHFGTVIPNRIFVGGIDYKVNESDLQHIFSQHGAVKSVKVVIDRSGVSKGYGFVTFETQEDALKILRDADGICFKDKKLIIGQAVRRWQTPRKFKDIHGHARHRPICCCYSPGYPHTYHDGVAYSHYPSVSPPPHHWPPAPPVVLPQSHQPVYQQPAYLYQCGPNQYQCPAVQSTVPSSPVAYPQQPPYAYRAAHGASVPPPRPVAEDAAPENPMFPHSHVAAKPKYT